MPEMESAEFKFPDEIEAENQNGTPELEIEIEDRDAVIGRHALGAAGKIRRADTDEHAFLPLSAQARRAGCA